MKPMVSECRCWLLKQIKLFVIPAKAGTQLNKKIWVPAFAGMTGRFWTTGC